MELNANSKTALTHFIEKLNYIFSGLPPVTVYWLSVDIRVLLRYTSAHPSEAEALARVFCDEFLRQAGSQATVLISAFNFEFPRTKQFDAEHSRIETGAFASLLLKTQSAHRLLMPFYSFLVFGQRADELLNTTFLNNTGPDSILEWVVNNHARLVTVGHLYNNSLPTIHHAEDVVGVSYRYRKWFSGELVRGELRKPTQCSFLVRNLDTCDGSSLTFLGDRHLRDRGIVRSKVLGSPALPIIVYDLDVHDVHTELVADLSSGDAVLVDYYGPQKPNGSVITREASDRLYLDEIKAFKATLVSAE